MIIKFNKIENYMVYLTVESEESDMELYTEKVYQRHVKRKEIPIIEKDNTFVNTVENLIGIDNLNDNIVKEMIPDIYSIVVKEHNIQTEIQPMIRITGKKPLVFELIASLKPIVELCDYHNLNIEPESQEIKKEEIDYILEGIRKEYASYTLVDRPVKEGDLVTVDIDGAVSGLSFINKKATKYQVASESPSDIPGLYKTMIGMKNGETKKTIINLPDNYSIKEMAGKEGELSIHINDIQEITLPELNDEFANMVAPDIKTLDMLKDRIEQNIRKEHEGNSQTRFEYKLMDTIINSSKINYPPIMIDMELEGLIKQYKKELQESSRDNGEYEEQLKQIDINKLKDRLYPMAEKRILWSLVINEIAKNERIDADDLEINEYIDMMISEVDEKQKEEQRQYFDEYNNRQCIRDIIKARKTIDRLTEIVSAK
jgi:trigger factor